VVRQRVARVPRVVATVERVSRHKATAVGSADFSHSRVRVLFIILPFKLIIYLHKPARTVVSCSLPIFPISSAPGAPGAPLLSLSPCLPLAFLRSLDKINHLRVLFSL
jgi:hypothetical protein